MKDNKKQYYRFGAYGLMLVGIGLLTSCGASSKYEKPDLNLPDSYPIFDWKLTLDQSDSVSIGLTSWREFFKDPELIALIDKGLAYNFDMQEAVKNIAIANLGASQSKLEWLPSIGANIGSVNYEYRGVDYYGNASSKYYNYKGEEVPTEMFVKGIEHITGLGLSWEIDIWGKIKNKTKQSLAEYLKTNEAKKAIQTQLISKIATGYYNLLLLEAQMEVAQANYELTTNTLKIVELQRDAGQITSLAIQQTRNQMLVAKALIPSIRKDIAVQENELSLLTGGLPNHIERKLKLTEVDYLHVSNPGIPLEMVRNRPDVQMMEFNLQSKNAAVGVSQASQYPSLSIDVGGGFNSMLAENWFNVPGALFGSLTGKLVGPLFNKKRLKTNFKVSLLERDKAEIALQKTVFTAVSEVTDALISISTIDEQISIAEEQVATSRLGVKQSNLLFNSGYATYIEVINAQKNMLDTELSLNKLNQVKLLSRLKLYKALGGGWQ